ncbi:hypothetical protein ISCGN_003463 [Ixodes scapularis]
MAVETGEPQFGVGRLQHRSSTIVFSAFKEMVAGVGLLAASLAVGISVPPRVVPAHRDHGTVGEPQFGVGRLHHRSSTIVFSAFKEMLAGVGLLAARLAVGISVQPHVVPTHRDHGTVGPETADDGRCTALFPAPLRPTGLRRIQRAKNTPKTPPPRQRGRSRDCARNFSTVKGSACEQQFGVGRLQHRSSTIVFSAFKEVVAGVGLLAACLAVGISVQPHVVPTHRDHGTVGPETTDDGRCPALFLAPFRPTGLRRIKRAKNTPKTPPRRHRGRNCDCARNFSTVTGSACEFVVFAKRAY